MVKITSDNVDTMLTVATALKTAQRTIEILMERGIIYKPASSSISDTTSLLQLAHSLKADLEDRHARKY